MDWFSLKEARRLHIFWGRMADSSRGDWVVEDAAGSGRGGGRNRVFLVAANSSIVVSCFICVFVSLRSRLVSSSITLIDTNKTEAK